jgi:cell division protein FtsW (lipid II flippase)
LLLLLPLPAVLLGAFAASRSGVSLKAFAVNGAAVVAGAGVAALVGRLPGPALARASLPLALVALLLTAATLLFPGLDGIHRWLALGPLRLHASTVVAPWVLLGMSVLLHQRFAYAAALAVAMSVLHAVQPDAGQGTAFSLAAALLLASARSTPWPMRALACAGTLAAGLAAWLQPDPLAAVPHVERIVHLAAGLSPVLGVVAVLALALLGVPAALGLNTRAGALSGSLLVYLAAAVGVTALGNFPVPVMGAGAGPILGWYLATGILAAACSRPP